MHMSGVIPFQLDLEPALDALSDSTQYNWTDTSTLSP